MKPLICQRQNEGLFSQMAGLTYVVVAVQTNFFIKLNSSCESRSDSERKRACTIGAAVGWTVT